MGAKYEAYIESEADGLDISVLVGHVVEAAMRKVNA